MQNLTGLGVSLFFVWSFAGPLGLASLPVVFVSVLLLTMRKFCHAPQRLLWWLCVPLMIFAIRDALQPSPAFFDCYFIVLLHSVLRQPRSLPRSVVCMLLLFCVWSNMSAYPVWGLLWLLFSISPITDADGNLDDQQHSQHVHFKRFLLIFSAAFVGGCLTPRGLLSWRDSFVLSTPELFVPLPSFGTESWTSLLHSELRLQDFAGLILWWLGTMFSIAGQYQLRRGDSRNRLRAISILFSEAIGVLLLAMISRTNMPFVAIWAMIRILSSHICLRYDPSSDASSVERKMRYIVPAITGSVMAVITLLAVADAFGVLTPTSGRLGWGIAQQNDLRLFNIPLESEASHPLIAWSADERSAGMILWLDPNSRVVDHPKRALVAGRTGDHDGLLHDLEMDRRAAYRTDAGTWGGWVKRLADWKADLVLVPVEKERLNQSLARSTWKSLDLDSPVLVYGKSEDPRLAAAILEILSQQGFVEVGPWQPSLDIYDAHGWRCDLIELVGGGPDAAPAVRQSTLFRTMDIPLASLRA